MESNNSPATKLHVPAARLWWLAVNAGTFSQVMSALHSAFRFLTALLAVTVLTSACSGSSPPESGGADTDATESDNASNAAETASGDQSDDASSTTTQPAGTVSLPQDSPISSAPGVETDKIRIGVMIRDVNQLLGSGFVEDLTVTQQVDRWRAEAARINDSGGINGRTVEIVVATWDPLVPESVLAACDRVVDRDAFVVLNVSGLETIATNCLIDPHARPVIVGENPTLANFDDAGDLLFSLEPPREILVRAALNRFEQKGWLVGRVAVVHNDLPGDLAAAQTAIEQLENLGYDVVSQEIPVSQGVEAARESLRSKIDELVAGQTETMLFLSNSTIAGPFGEAMESAGATWTNLIVDADNIADPFAAARLGRQWIGAHAVGVFGGATMPETSVDAACREGWDRFLNGEYGDRPRGDWSFSAGLEARSTRGAAADSIDPPGDIGYTECLLMHVVFDALERVPLNFTVVDFVEALETGGRIPMPLGVKGSFSESEHWLADRSGLLQFLGSDSGFCPTTGRNCFVPQGGDRRSFRPLPKRPTG